MSDQVDNHVEMNLTGVLLDHAVARGLGDRPAFHTAETTITYEQLQTVSRQAAELFAALGITIEQRVAFCLPDGLTWLACFLGAVRMGAVAVPLSSRAQNRDYMHMLRDSRARVLVIDAAMLPAFAEAIRESPHLSHVLVSGGSNARYDSFERRLTEMPGRAGAVFVSPDDAAFWLYTSGTTGVPKAVVHRHGDCLHCVHFAHHVLGFSMDDVAFSTSKLFFAYALGNILFTSLRYGATGLLFSGRPTPGDIVRYLQERRPTLFFSVPSFYAALLELDSVPRDAFESIRLCISAGERLPETIWQRWTDRFGVELLDGLGCSETIYTFISNRTGQVRAGSTGQVVPGFQARLVNQDGKEVAPSEPGTLLVRADSCFSKYWNQDDITRRTLLGEWFCTGDVLSRDDQGFFYYHGRRDDMLKVNGEWVAPAMIEEHLLSHPSVLEVAVVGIPDQFGLVKPVAFVVPLHAHGVEVDLVRALQLYAAERLNPNRRPREIRLVNELPRTATGKLQRFRLREQIVIP